MPAGSARLRVPHGVIVVGDREGVVPVSFDGGSVAASTSAVAVATLHAVDGEVSIRLAARADTAEHPSDCAYQGALVVPGGSVCVCTTANDILLDMSAPSGSQPSRFGRTTTRIPTRS